MDGINLAKDITKQPWEHPWLIQRLNRPYADKDRGGTNPFSFGGGLVNGGMSKEARKFLASFWEFDYMGASEFEWGAVPAAMQALVEYRKADCLVTFIAEVTGPVAEKDGRWARASKTKKEKKQAMVLCHKAHKENVKAVLAQLTASDYVTEPSLKEPANAWRALFNQTDDQRVIGGLELDNGWLYMSMTAKESIDGILKFFDLKEGPVEACVAPKAEKKGKN